MPIEQQEFGTTVFGEEATLFKLQNDRGAMMSVTDYGCAITSLMMPDRHGEFADVVLGYDRLQDYESDPAYMGAVVGRFANRIAHGRFSLGGKKYTLAQNNGPHHLHGGRRGFDKYIWEAQAVETRAGPTVIFRRKSPHGEEGYPGNLDIQVRYTLSHYNALDIVYTAKTDAKTHISLTQHSYFNLSGGVRDILGHQLQILSEATTEVDEGLIPTGEYLPVVGTPFDFREPHLIGERINSDDTQLRYGQGYDHNFVLTLAQGTVRTVAHLVDPVSGRKMTVESTPPGLQLYTANHFDGRRHGKRVLFDRHRGVCLETQFFPDTPNKPNFVTTELKPGETYQSRTIYRFGIVK